MNYPYEALPGPATERQSGCHHCGDMQGLEPCSVKGCGKEFCPRCTMRCAGCDGVLCGHDAQIVGSDALCPRCAIQTLEHYEQMFDLFASRFSKGEPCPDCGGVLDKSDIFPEWRMEAYHCKGCTSMALRARTAETDPWRHQYDEGERETKPVRVQNKDAA